MRFSSLLTLAATFLATTVSCQYLNQTGPFNLQLVSSDERYNGHYLVACHEGAAIEGLCPSSNTSIAPGFYYNYSDTSNFVSRSGYLTYLLKGANFQVFEPMSFSYNPGSNVAVPLMQPTTNGQLIAFDDNNLMYVPGTINDTQNPINPSAMTENLYRWYVCQTFVGYAYETLAWTLGKNGPQNPSCCAVNVKRVTQ